ncbi:MAG: hypothetical protein ACRDUA_17690, partial [Micromonosporaceae bacterium]
IAGTETTRSRISEARAEAGDALNLAYELGEVAAAHGWEGVASSMHTTREAMEALLAHLDDADQATVAASTSLSEITSDLGKREVAERLAGVLHHLDQVRGGIDTATSGADDARQACQQAGEPHELLQILQIIYDDLGEARQSIEKTKTTAESERQAAETWGD